MTVGCVSVKQCPFKVLYIGAEEHLLHILNPYPD